MPVDLAPLYQKIQKSGLKASKNAPVSKGIHEIRKHCKKVNALRKLVHSSAPNRKIKKIKKALEEFREKDVERILHHQKPASDSSKKAKDALREARRKWASLDPPSTGQKTERMLEKRLRGSFGKVIRWRKKCRRTGSDEDFHEWRQKTKDLQYQMEILGLSERPLHSRLKEVGDVLGQAHDLYVLNKSPARMKALYKKALGLGARLRFTVSDATVKFH